VQKTWHNADFTGDKWSESLLVRVVEVKEEFWIRIEFHEEVRLNYFKSNWKTLKAFDKIPLKDCNFIDEKKFLNCLADFSKKLKINCKFLFSHFYSIAKLNSIQLPNFYVLKQVESDETRISMRKSYHCPLLLLASSQHEKKAVKLNFLLLLPMA
jgi:hypothetical protein